MSKRSTSLNSKTDWDRLNAMKDEEIDFSDCPELTPKMFANAVVRRGLPSDIRKEQITLRLDSDVLEWFRHQGKGYQTRINALLREYMKAQELYENSKA